jgi:hypothetical protein
MSDSNCCNQKTRTVAAYLVGGIGVFAIMGALAYLVVGQQVPAVDATRAELRAKYRAELDAAAVPAVTGYSLDADALGKGNKVYHVPIERALEIAAEDFKDPAAGRAKLLQRLEDKMKQQSFE